MDSRVRTALGKRGFGVPAEIDVKATLEAKIGAEVDDYRIFGACKAIQVEPRVGQCCL